MKVLKIEDNKCYYSIDGNNTKPITEISKDDIYKILDIIYNSSDFEIDEIKEDTKIDNEVEKIIYTNLYNQFKTFIDNKESIKSEIEDKFKDVIEKYDLNDKESE